MKSRSIKLSGLLLIGLILFSWEIKAQIAGYDFYKPLVINGGQVQGTNTNFPILISYTDSDLVGKTQADGDDIVFATSATSTTILNHQLESFNPSTGALRVWVQVPTVSTAGQTIFMFYGNGSATSQSTSLVWDNNYQLVMHMDDLTNATQVSQTITNNGTTSAAGQIGNGRDFERDQNDFISVADNASLDITGQITISFWFRQESAQAPDYVTKGTNESYEATSRNGIRTRFSKNGGNNLTTPNSDDLITGQWQYIVFVQSGSGRNIYQDGVSVASDGNTTAFATNNNPLQISRNNDAVDGIMDEVRISNIARSANWIATEFNNQLNPGTFSTPGAEVELIPPNAPLNISATSLIAGDIQISFDDVDEPAAQSGVGTYSIKRSNTSGSGYSEVGTVIDNESANYIFTDNSGTDGTTYFYVITALDNDGNESPFSTEVSALSDGSATVPTNITSTVVSATSVEISFNDVDESGSGIISYSVKRSNTQGGGYSEVGTVTDNENASYIFTDNTVTANNEYYYIVTAFDNLGNESGNSAEVSANTDLITPLLTSASANGNTLALDYNENLDIASTPLAGDFIVRINGSPVTITNAYINTSSVYVVYSPSANFGESIEIDYTAGANPIQDDAGNQVVNLIAQSVFNNTADNTPPSAPLNVVATAIFGGDINISFDDVDESGSGVSSYSVKRSTTSGNGYVQIGTVTDNESTSYTFNDNATVNGTTYYYVITSIDGSSNESSNSNQSSAEAGSVTDNTAPVLSSSSVGDDVLVLDYDEDLNSSSVPSISDFVLRINATPVTISSVFVNGDKVSLIFTPDVVPGDNVVLDYTAGTNPIEDIAGNNASNLSSQSINNQLAFNTGFGPNPCPIVNGKDIAWSCFNGTNNATSITAEIGDLVIATVTASSGSSTIFSPNALQSWASGAFSGDQFNGPQLNPNGASGNVTSFDVLIPSSIPSDAIVFSLNRLRPNGGGTSYTMEAFDGLNQRVDLTGWINGQGTDGGVCTNTVSLNYANAGETIQFQPTVSGNPSCASSSTPIWFRISNTGVERIEIRKIVESPDNIHIGIGVVADFGDAPNTYGTLYNSRSIPAAFHLLNNTVPNSVYFGSGVDGDGNGAANNTSTGDDTEVSSIGGGDDEDGIASLPPLNSAETSYTTTLVCTDGGYVSGWVDLDQSDTFDPGEYDSNVCSGGNVTLNWNGITGLVTGTTHARFRIASDLTEIANPIGGASDGEVEDYTLDILDPLEPDLEISKSVDNSTPVEGENIFFTVKVKNLGPDPATEIKVTDQLPAGLTYVGNVAEQGTYVNSTGIWNLGTLSVLDSTSLVIQATVNASTLGQTITNNASITSLKETDPNLSNNAASSGITVVPEASDIGVSITVDDNTVLVGQTVEYEIIAVNNGPEDATGLSIIDQLPSGLTYQSNTTTVGTYSNATGIWSIGNLVSGDRDTLIISVQIAPGSTGNQITNSADLNALNQNDPNAANNTAAVSIDVISPSYPTNCNEVTGLVFTGSTLSSGSAGQVGAIYRFNNVTTGVYAEFEILTINNANLVNFDQIASGGLDTNFQPQIEAVDETQNDGYIDFEIRFYDSVTDNPRYLTFSASAVDVDGDPDGAREFAGFQRLTSFTVETNTDLIQSSEGIFTTFESAQPIVVPGIDPNDTNNLAFTTYTNEPSFRIRAGIKDPTATGFTQRLFAFNFDPCISNNFSNPSSSDIVDISVTKSVDFITPSETDVVTYTIVAKNEQGNSVGNVEITDQIPSGLTYVPNSATATKGNYNDGSGIWDIGTFTGQESATLTIQATVDNGEAGNTITNTATLTSNTGTDGNTSNNSASVDIIVFDPNSGLTCNEPPLFSFTNPTLEQGNPLSINSVYRFSNIASGVDAIVKVVDINNATLDDIDADGTANSPANFSPFFTALGGGGYVDYEIRLVQTGTNTPVKRSFALTGLDIDGTSNNGNTLTDYLGFAQNRSSTIQGGANLTVGSSGPFQTFESSVITDGNGTFDLDHMAYIVYNYTSILQIRTGSNTSAGYSDDRLVDIDFTQCRNQDFANPVINTRNANISVSKTADETNPLENETVNFTISVTNSGTEDATELDINETLPAGLTLVQATPTQGIYNQLTKLWSIGTLSNGATASLVLETTVNAGLNQDSLVNTAYVNGLNQFDPNALNDTSSVTLYLSVQISGTVFEDIKGDGYLEDLNFGDASGDQQALENVEVHLFKDGGDGFADGTDDEYLRSTTTNNAGLYTFNIGEDADFWIVVDSKTGDLSNGTTWGEQTYSAAGGLCEDGAGNTTIKTSLGHCFGGRRGTISDNISANPVAADLANAEHVIKRTVSGSGITGIDFGFSFNVVTQVVGLDRDLNSARFSQGGIHQFILNANSITGSNSMRFVPATPTTASGGGGAWWRYSLATELPVITDALTTIDGTAYSLNAPKTTRDDNPGSVGSNSTVGVDNISISTVSKKEFEISLSDFGSNALVVNTTGAFVIRNIGLFNNSVGIKVQNASSGLIENNIIGPVVSGQDPSSSLRLETGILFEGGSSPSTLIQRNYIAFLEGSAIKSNVANSVITVFKNEIYQVGLIDSQADGIEGIGTWTITQNLISEVGNSGSADLDGGSGIEIGANSGNSSGNTIRNNTIRNNKLSGINVINSVSNTLIEKNIINGNGTNYTSGSPKKGAGIKLTSPNSVAQQGIRITKNSFYDNKGISIDRVTGGTGVADGVSPNDGILDAATTSPNRGLDYPVFTLATLNGSVLTVEGYIGTTSTKLSGVYTIEIYKSDNDSDNDGLIEIGGALTVAHGEGRNLLGTITTTSNGTFATDITLSGAVPLAFNDRITGITISSANNTSEFSGNQRVVPTGVGISGFVYHDTNHNMIKDASEVGLENVTMVLYNIAANSCKSVLTNAQGEYQFTNVLNGSYNLIESFGQSVPTPDICTPAEVDPDNFISTTPNLRSVTVNNLPVFQNFGDYEGVKISGTVFNDNGISSGIGNDGIKNGGETGLASQTVKVVTSTNSLIEQVVSAADGTYSLFVPASTVGESGTVKVVELNSTDIISTGGSSGTTSGSYNIATDETTFNISLGTIYTGVDFADVQVSRLLTDGERTALPGAVVIFQHLFEANTSGDVLFTTNSINNPTNPNWPIVLYEDTNCNGEIDSGEPVILPTQPISVIAEQNVCLVLKVTAPYGLNTGASSTTTITATFSFDNTSPIIQEILNRSDLVTIGTETAGLIILKSVDKAQALPGSNLVYSIDYENLGDEPITQVEIIDVIPSFTTYVSSNCGALPTGITNCTITAPNVGATGTLKWTFTGTLNPGQTGTVVFTVKIDD